MQHTYSEQNQFDLYCMYIQGLYFFLLNVSLHILTHSEIKEIVFIMTPYDWR